MLHGSFNRVTTPNHPGPNDFGLFPEDAKTSGHNKRDRGWGCISRAAGPIQVKTNHIGSPLATSTKYNRPVVFVGPVCRLSMWRNGDIHEKPTTPGTQQTAPMRRSDKPDIAVTVAGNSHSVSHAFEIAPTARPWREKATSSAFLDRMNGSKSQKES